MEFLKNMLGEKYSEFSELLGDTKLIIDDGNYIHKLTYDKVVAENELLNGQLLTTQADIEGLKGLGTDKQNLVDKVKSMQDKHTAELYEMQKQKDFITLNHLLDYHLKDKTKDIDIVKGLIDMDKLVLNGNVLIGLDDEVNHLKVKKPFLFEEGVITLQGATPEVSQVKPTTINSGVELVNRSNGAKSQTIPYSDFY